MEGNEQTGHITPCTSHSVLPASLKSSVLCCVVVWVLTVGLCDCGAD